MKHEKQKMTCCLLLLLSLTGCRVRDTARLRSVETMGIDLRPGELVLSVSTGAGTEELPSLHLSAAGSSIHDCMAKLEQSAEGQELFYSHLRFLVLGESAAKELCTLLDFFERAPELRLTLPVYTVRGEAEPLVTDEENEIGGLLRSLERSGKQTGLCTVPTLLEADRGLRQDAAALCAAVRDGELTGYALLRPGEPPRFSSAEEALGLTLLYKGLRYAAFTVELPRGYAVVETQNYRSGSRRPCAYTLRELSGESSTAELNAAVSARLEAAERAALAFLGSAASPPPCRAELKRGYDLTGGGSP